MMAEREFEERSRSSRAPPTDRGGRPHWPWRAPARIAAFDVAKPWPTRATTSVPAMTFGGCRSSAETLGPIA